MILLTEFWNEDAKKIAFSLNASGCTYDTVVIQYNGFGGKGLLSPYEHYIYEGNVPEKESPLYFDRLKVPELFEIRSSNSEGEIYDFDDLRGRIFYAEPKSNRYVRVVDWLDRSGKVCCSDHYNQYGHRFAQTVLSAEQKPVHRTYYRPDGTEVITENLLTGDIVLTLGGKTLFFKGKTEFTLYYLQNELGEIDRIFYNSLSVPFFVTNRYCARVKKLEHNVLFWQEPIAEDIPGNMKLLLQDSLAGTETIAVQIPHVYQKIQSLPVDHSRFRDLGFIYADQRQNTYGRHALVLTNSDQVQMLDKLAEQLPEIEFHVGALTEMSPKLLQMETHPNVHLYPAATEKQIDRLRKCCDLYLDINAGGEVLDAVRTAFLDNALVLGFENVLHHRYFMDREKNIFKADDGGVRAMAERLRQVTADRAVMDASLKRQRLAANAVSAEDYRSVIG